MPARTVPATLALVLMLAPTAWFAWSWRTMPQLGGNHDEMLYYIGGKSLADGKGYRVLSLPGEPYQTKYPPGLSAISAVAWKLGGGYPANLPLHTLACWLFLAGSTFAIRKWALDAGIPAPSTLALAALWSLNPYAFQFGTTLLSELPFTAMLLGCLLCLHRPGTRWALVGGLLAGAAFLTRTVGLLLLAPAIAWLWANGRRREIVWFGLPPAAAAAAWFIWTGVHKASGENALSLYYLNYLGYHMRHFLWEVPLLAAWKNVDGILYGLGASVFPQSSGSLVDKILAQVVAVGGIAGAVRMARREWRGPAALYAGFSALLIGVMVVWHFPANERLILPAAPLILAGFVAEVARMAAGVRRSWTTRKKSDRVAAGIFTAAAMLGALYAAHLQYELITALLPEANARSARRLRESEPMMEWIRVHLPTDSAVIAELDPLFYLRSGGRHAASIFTSPKNWYRDDYPAQVSEYAAIEKYAAENGLGYLYLAGEDFERRFPPEYHKQLHELWRRHPGLVEVHRSGSAALYKIAAK